MIGKILKSTRGKPCSCPTGKICSDCKTKKVIHPQVIVEEPRRLPAPITITYYKPPEKIYKQNATTVQYLEKPSRWKIRKRQKYEPQQQKSTALCRWYKRRKALKQLIKEHEKEKEILRQKRRDEYERERIRDLINWEQAKRHRTSSLSSIKEFKWEKTAKQRNQSLAPPQTKKLVYIKEKSAIVKPRAQSKYVSVKQYNARESITKRFVNYCYRFCCQLYCYMTCIILIIITIIFFM